MEFLPWKRLEYADGLSRLIPKSYERLEKTDCHPKIRTRNKKRAVPYGSYIWQSRKLRTKQKKTNIQIIDQHYKKIDGEKIFPIYDGILMKWEALFWGK